MVQCFSPKLGILLADRLELLKVNFELSTFFIDKVITLQSQKKWSKCDRNNVRFLPVTATYALCGFR